MVVGLRRGEVARHPNRDTVYMYMYTYIYIYIIYYI